MIKAVQNFFDNVKFRNKLIAITTVTAVIIGGVSIMGYEYTAKRYNSLLYDQTAISLNYISIDLSAKIQTITSLSQMLSLNKNMQENLSNYIDSPDIIKKRDARSLIIQSIYHYIDKNIESIDILLENGDLIQGGTFFQAESPEIYKKIKEECQRKQGAAVWFSSNSDDRTIFCARQIRKTSYSDFLSSLGYLIIRIDLKSILQQSSVLTENSFIYISDDSDNPIYSSDYPNKISFSVQSENNKKYEIKKSGGQTLFIVHGHLSSPPWNIRMGIPYADVFESVILAKIATILLIIVSIVLTLVLSGVCVQSITKRFDMLIFKMNRLKSGKLEVLESDNPPGQDELGLLNQYFDEMTLEFKAMIDDNYVKQMLIAQAQLKALEQQINPHFLYNTLDTIKWFAKHCGEKNIPVIVESLGSLLRNSLSQDSDVISLKKELSFVNNYLQIQKIRFPDLLNLVVDVDEWILEVKTPKMSIQPLVENAIIYSMEEIQDVYTVNIRIKDTGDTVTISVENDGSQIDENILEKLNNNSIKPTGHGIGLVNIDTRIKLIFGEKYGLSFSSFANHVIVSFSIPKSYQSN